MKKSVTLLFTLALVTIAFHAFTNQSGPGGKLANDPGAGNCTQCHTGTALNGGSGSPNNIQISGNFSGGGYIPDSTYNVKITFTQSSISKFGINATALYSSDSSTMAGSFTITSNRLQKRTTTIGGKSRQYVEQTSTGSSATSTNTAEWAFQWKAPSTNVGDIWFYVVTMSANGNGQNSGDQVYFRKIVINPSSLLPVATATASNSNPCSGETVNFTGSGTNSPTSYSWVFPGGSPSVSSAQNPSVSFTSAGKKYVTLQVTNAKGISNKDTVIVDVKKPLTAFIAGGNTQTICPGDSVELTASLFSGYSYNWSNGATGNKIFAKKAGDYYVVVDDGSCSKISNVVTVSHYTVPTPTITPSVADSICRNGTLTLTSTTGYDSFYWYNKFAQIASSTTNTHTLTVDSGSSYRVRAWTSNHCLSAFSDSVELKTVKAEDGPVISCKNTQPFSLDFGWTVATHNGVQISLDSGKSWKAPSSGTMGLTHSMSGLDPETDYQLMVRAILGVPCNFSEASTQVCRTGKCSPINAQVVSDTAICSGEDVNVVVHGLANEEYSLNFEGGNHFKDTAFQFSPGQTATHILYVTDSTLLGCPPKKLSFKVRVDNISTPILKTQKTGNIFCEGDTIIFTASSGNETYRFFVNGNLRSTQSDSFYFESTFANGDSAFVEVENGQCSATSDLVHLLVAATPTATFTYSRVHKLYTFIPDNAFYKSYNWDFGDGFTSVLQQPDHNFGTSSNSTKNVKLEVTDNNDCVNLHSEDVVIPDFSGIEILQNDNVAIFPNPAFQTVNVHLKNASETQSHVKIYTLSGNVVYSSLFETLDFSIDLTTFAGSLYVIEIQNGEINSRQLLIKN
ncbi:MAG: PKD domain-containing protein [Flavobacteriales bacterium]|nr:PKD domain-containing protein [Flavobacteriales bacterium]